MILCDDADIYTSMVLGGCHSLVSIEGSGIVGDPIEIAGMNGVGWKYDASTETVTPGNFEGIEKAITVAKAELEKDYGIHVSSIVNLEALIEFSHNNKDFHSYTFELEQYRNSWGA